MQLVKHDNFDYLILTKKLKTFGVKPHSVTMKIFTLTLPKMPPRGSVCYSSA